MNPQDPHTFFSNSDILLRIFEALRDVLELEGVEQQRKELAHCIRVCKAFEDPAMRVLWAQLPSISPLLNLLETSLDYLPEDPDIRRTFPTFVSDRS